MLSRAGTPVEFFRMGISLMLLGLLAILGLVIVDASVRRVDWNLPGTWFWVALMAAIFASGLATVLKSRSARLQL